jgi:hypothetical protein
MDSRCRHHREAALWPLKAARCGRSDRKHYQVRREHYGGSPKVAFSAKSIASLSTCGDHDGAAVIFTSTQAAPSTPARMLLRTASHDRLAARSRLAGCRSRPIGRRSRSRRARVLTAALQLTAAKRSERCGCVASIKNIRCDKHPVACWQSALVVAERARPPGASGLAAAMSFMVGRSSAGPCRNRGDDRH